MSDLFPYDLLQDAEALLVDLQRLSLRLATAESCTGGLLIGLLTGGRTNGEAVVGQPPGPGPVNGVHVGEPRQQPTMVNSPLIAVPGVIVIVPMLTLAPPEPAVLMIVNVLSAVRSKRTSPKSSAFGLDGLVS